MKEDNLTRTILKMRTILNKISGSKEVILIVAVLIVLLIVLFFVLFWLIDASMLMTVLIFSTIGSGFFIESVYSDEIGPKGRIRKFKIKGGCNLFPPKE